MATSMSIASYGGSRISGGKEYVVCEEGSGEVHVKQKYERLLAQ